MKLACSLFAAIPFLSAVLLCAQTAQPDLTHASVPFCKADQLSVTTDDENGNFDSTSHSGTLLVLRNLGPGPCRLAPFPRITLLEGSTALPAQGVVPGTKFMHPGPVILPIVLASGAEATSTLRWVSDEVYAKSRCVSPNALAVEVGGDKHRTEFEGRLCGEAGKPLTYEMTRFALDPIYSAN